MKFYKGQRVRFWRPLRAEEWTWDFDGDPRGCATEGVVRDVYNDTVADMVEINWDDNRQVWETRAENVEAVEP